MWYTSIYLLSGLQSDNQVLDLIVGKLTQPFIFTCHSSGRVSLEAPHDIIFVCGLTGRSEAYKLDQTQLTQGV